MVSFVFWSQVPPSSHLVAMQEPVWEDPFEESIHTFLDMEEERTVTVLHSSKAAISEAESLTEPVSSVPVSFVSENVKIKTYIPLNVVPATEKKQPEKSQSKLIPRAKKALQPVKVKHSQSQRRVITRELRRHLEQTENRADKLMMQSSDSFSRGLMSLSDYNLALNVALDSKIEAARIRQSKHTKLPFLLKKQKLIQQAVEQLQSFNQPASQGWYGDLVHAKLLLAQNRYEIARENKDISNQQVALGEISKFSDDYYEIRKVELQVGETSLSEFRRASRSIYVADQERNLILGQDKNDMSSLADYARELKDIKSEVEWLASQGAGLGRSDLLEMSKAQLTYTQGKYYLKNKQQNESRSMFTESMGHAKTAWSTRINTFYPVGTASLHDISTAWIMWKAAETESAELVKSNDTITFNRELKSGLDRMVSTADSIRDQSGRNASDISLVHCLNNSDVLVDLQQKQIK